MRTPALLISCLLASISLCAEQITLAMPAQKTGTGTHDRYCLYAHVGDEMPRYEIEMAISKLALDDLAVTIGDQELKITKKDTAKVLLKKFPYFFAEIDRANLETGSVSGLTLQVKSGKQLHTIKVPREEITALLRDAAKQDRYSLASFSTTLDPAVIEAYTKAGTSKLTGQAFLKTQGGDVKLGAGALVTLVPADPWTEKYYDLVAKGVKVENLPEDSRRFLARTIRTAEADASGNFEFSGLPAGVYRMSTVITWQYATGRGLRTTGGPINRIVRIGEAAAVKANLTSP